MKKLVSLLLVIAACISFSGCGKKQTANIYDSNGDVVVSVESVAEFKGYNATYLDIAISEAAQIIATINDCEIDSAQKQLKNYNIYTYLNPTVSAYMADAYNKIVRGTDFGCAMTDHSGKILAAYSAGSDTTKNYATQKMQQHSAMKPLAVYAPAIESGIINWSTLTEDSPYKVRVNSKGVKYDWPSNANNKYTYQDISVYKAIKQSTNTVAVKVLSKYGVNNSIDFLQSKLGIDVSAEQYRATIYGEDEVIGNIALGATQAGSTPIDMAGYYQIFANGGKYTAPTAISRITDLDGKAIYTDNRTTTQVISTETSYIMNELLRGVIKSGGTGDEAYVEGVQISGKTGTGDANADNWFVGITPEFSCAVWHSNFNNINNAAKVFANITENVGVTNTLFMTSPNVQKCIYCAQSGMLFGSGCQKAEMGYFLKDNLPQSCTLH